MHDDRVMLASKVRKLLGLSREYPSELHRVMSILVDVGYAFEYKPDQKLEPAWLFTVPPPTTREEFGELLAAARAAQRLNPPAAEPPTAAGAYLDMLAQASYGMSRLPKETDSSFRTRMTSSLLRPNRGIKPAGVP
jgi:hypothetical protein